MKKLLLLTIITTYALSSNAQIERFLSYKNDNLSSWVIPKTREEKKNLFSIFLKRKEFSEIAKFSETLKEFFDFFKISDFNKDGINDVLYEGYSGSEGTLIFFYQGKGNNEFDLVFESQGKILGTSKNKEFFNLDIYEYSCCGGNNNALNRYVITDFGNKIAFQLIYRESYFDGTLFPKVSFNKPIPFVVKNENYKLRNTPNINDEPIDWTSYNASESNILAEYPKGSRGVALAEETDETGRKWFFVKMFNNLKPDNSMFSLEDDNYLNCYHYGWMSSNFLEILE